jgi:hypothetical protein
MERCSRAKLTEAGRPSSKYVQSGLLELLPALASGFLAASCSGDIQVASAPECHEATRMALEGRSKRIDVERHLEAGGEGRGMPTAVLISKRFIRDIAFAAALGRLCEFDPPPPPPPPTGSGPHGSACR